MAGPRIAVHNCLGACMEFRTIEELVPKLAAKPKQVLWAVNGE